VAKGHVASRDEAFADLLHNGSKYYVTHIAPTPEDAIKVIRAAGGVAVIAHPFATRRGQTLSAMSFPSLIAAGLNGVEVDHRDHTHAEREQLRGLAGDLGLVITGASDYHGINNEVTYNWQQWFDNTLKQRYQNDIELGLTKEQAEEKVKVQGQFARDFIDKYLTPRFNESKSMNEFVDYLDVKQSEQNPFQTQDIVNAVKLVADLKANQYIEELRKTPDRYFDSTFYFNPAGDKAKEDLYLNQAATVSADWEAAKRGDGYWASQAYRFGVDVNDKDAFARMHFQVKGQGQGYDPADDILNASKVSNYIYNQILPALNEEALAQGTVFGQFLKPEEFADEMLKGLNPNDKKTWDEVLKRYGLESYGGSLEELKSYITDATRTGSAQEIRDQIKYLNERNEKPTQEVLGVSYIQREQDYSPKKTIEGESELYKVFQSAGFQGTEDDFYSDFFPDVDRSEQVALTKAGKNEALKTTGLDLSDPYASLGTIESFFGDEEETKSTTQKKEPTTNSYFRIAMGEDEEEPLSKSKSGESILGEFTSMFKGL
jgi:predicted metal-dependent phosphoesterase TrpH